MGATQQQSACLTQRSLLSTVKSKTQKGILFFFFPFAGLWNRGVANNQDWGPQVKFCMFLFRMLTVDRRKGGDDEVHVSAWKQKGNSCICLGIVRSFAEWVSAAEIEENGDY